MSSGSLGQGISAAAGMALSAKLSNDDYRVYTLLGDGEIQEGQIWEAAMAAGNPGAIMPYVWGGAIGGFIVALVTIFKKAWSPYTAPLYAALEGLFLGAVSAMFELRFPGIVMQAVGLTFGTLAALLLAYRSGLVKATENFKLGVVAATGAIALLYLVNMGLRLFGL